ncbi:uncharacterized protein LOC128546339 [Mercenaria mercenaria]|uniref:uncharacterized protein LOC128546339 n=1 Tax=Mercenaria mercenaria TaxID=6596 RepID=UPI00234ED0BD|nr:uncharacterized protein LOC128546339 [Mercenaria mercenaria]
MLVSCQDDGTFRLHGSFRHNDELYHMSHSNVLEPSPHHYVQRTPPTNKKFKNDGVMPPQEVIDELRMSGSSSRQRRDDPPIPGGNIVELLFTVDKAFYKE